MSGNCEDGWDISVQEDLDAIFKDAKECDLLKINLQDANGTILFPSITNVESITGTLSKDFDTLNLTQTMRIEKIELEPSKSPPDEIVFSEALVLTGPNEYEPTWVSKVTLRERSDAPPLEMGISQASSLETLELDNIAGPADFHGTKYLDTFIVKNSEFGDHLERIEHLHVSDMTNRSLGLYNVDWIRNAYFNNIKTDTANFISTQIDSDLFIQNNKGLKQDLDQFFSSFTTIGRDLLIRDNANLDGSFDKLTYAKNITVENTVDSALAWPALEKAVTIKMHGSPGTKLPGNMDNLEFADDIYLNGEIMT
jgi:hypothetical protein